MAATSQTTSPGIYLFPWHWKHVSQCTRLEAQPHRLLVVLLSAAWQLLYPETAPPLFQFFPLARKKISCQIALKSFLFWPLSYLQSSMPPPSMLYKWLFLFSRFSLLTLLWIGGNTLFRPFPLNYSLEFAYILQSHVFAFPLRRFCLISRLHYFIYPLFLSTISNSDDTKTEEG